MRPRLFRLGLLLVAAACGTSSSTAPAAPSPVGEWALTSVNGHSLPSALYSASGGTVDIVSEDLIVRFDRTYAITTSTRAAGSVAPPDVAMNVGYWDSTSGSLTIGIASAELSGNTLTVRWSSALTAIYKRV